MTASIGTVTVNLMRGLIDRPGQTLQPIERPGSNYARQRQIGQRGRASEISTVAYYATLAYLNAAIVTYKALCGTVATITDNEGNSFLNCAVQGVEITNSQACVVNGVAQWRLAAQWTVQQGDPAG